MSTGPDPRGGASWDAGVATGCCMRFPKRKSQVPGCLKWRAWEAMSKEGSSKKKKGVKDRCHVFLAFGQPWS